MTRIAPGLIVGYFSNPLHFSLSYSTDGQIFAENSRAEQLRRQPARRVERALHPGGPLDARTHRVVRPDGGQRRPDRPDGRRPARQQGARPPHPRRRPRRARRQAPAPLRRPGTPPTAPAGTVPVVPGVDVGRTRTHYVVVNPWVGFAYDPRTRFDAGYTYTWTDVENGAQDRMHRLTAGVSRELTPRDRGHLREILDIFDPGGIWHLPVGRDPRRLDARAHRPDHALPRGGPPGQRRGRLGGRRHRSPRPPPRERLALRVLRADRPAGGRTLRRLDDEHRERRGLLLPPLGTLVLTASANVMPRIPGGQQRGR